MKAYAGIDIGTTNTKIMVITKNGIENVFKVKTPKNVINGVEYFDLDKLEHAIEKVLCQIKDRWSLAGLSCTSVGESVVAVSRGKKLYDPIVWYDTCTKPLQEKYKDTVETLAPYEISGSRDIYYFSLYKILYMYEKSIVKPDQVEHWLPISSYITYKLTRKPLWDMTQACRSHMVDIHRRKWNEELLKYFQIDPDQLGELHYTGSFAGQWENVPVFLSGHDHLTGTYGLTSLFGSEIIYDSMGTASLITAIAHEKDKNMHMKSPFMKNGGLVGIAFEDKQYYLASGVRYHGKLIELILKIFGMKTSSKRFIELNEQISVLPVKLPFYIYSNGDNIVGENADGINFLKIPANCSQIEMLQSVYLYLCYTSRLTVENLEKFVGQLPVIAGGGLTDNKTFISYKASMLGKTIYYLNTAELTALGAAISAIRGANDFQMIEYLRKKIHFEKVFPNKELSEKMNELYKEIQRGYERLIKEVE
ncbi:FGGY-family carbohydrate kinase [Pseudothermotoga lettingae]|jgi:sugar (pentulose or hexulose) kinase|uniref:Carbohydrate kinase FGGY n=1 Tax=Pseudothermotoga lettingae (strain ATCC BAA-301 / DSM 14385 / NBRC 107922 / TMO) TaxID=416591 RepID=A8F7Y0_PSELT|nr:FGGY-family carbohydrate kinase [Pseudothermotoga lettingae]ABV34264.1 carbohydrate kinase FGGY [Pseudothermotoga lettingae TMO]KUK21313.1 MAG: Carbohydrate kinase FGGY [Pseudothermotoga lettingae]GLI48791.1 sugar kinase [Pseudothermotoga lettingae TMO]HBT26440.1 sugar kinase [Pseudothermotoga sp.]